jgi:hypothetical protein
MPREVEFRRPNPAPAQGLQSQQLSVPLADALAKAAACFKISCCDCRHD